MPFKINISEKSGKTWKLEIQDEVLVGKSIGETINGKEISTDLDGYELKITGAGDKAGFPHKPDVEGPELKKVLLTKGWGMHAKKKGLRKKKTVRGKQISEKTAQINLIIEKQGPKKLSEIFPDQNKKAEEPKEEKIAEEIAEEVKEEIKEDIPSSPETKTEEQKEQAAEKVAEEVKEEVEKVSEKIAEKEN